MTLSSTVRIVLMLASSALAQGCLDDDGLEGTSGGSTTFIALQSDFQRFRSWSAFDIPDSATVPHDGGAVVSYLNRVPVSGSASFPVGTIIVKATEKAEAPQTWALHGMVKRGSTFNAGGASGWEFFELAINDNDSVIVIWRGAKPPVGHGYEATPGATAGTAIDVDCNSCHAGKPENDHVLSNELLLRNF